MVPLKPGSSVKVVEDGEEVLGELREHFYSHTFFKLEIALVNEVLLQ